MRALIVVVAATSLAGCAHPRWNHDESERIDEVMACEPWQANAQVAQGIAVYAAPPLAPAWKDGEGYQLRRGATDSRRVKRATTQKPPRKKQVKPDSVSDR